MFAKAALPAETRLPGLSALARLWARWTDAGPEPTPEDDRDRARFVQDMICENPDAFAAECDVHAMFYTQPCRF